VPRSNGAAPAHMQEPLRSKQPVAPAVDTQQTRHNSTNTGNKAQLTGGNNDYNNNGYAGGTTYKRSPDDRQSAGTRGSCAGSVAGRRPPAKVGRQQRETDI
ncbi:unnamed protein product, partial [Pleuronectes platessa]